MWLVSTCKSRSWSRQQRSARGRGRRHGGRACQNLVVRYLIYVWYIRYLILCMVIMIFGMWAVIYIRISRSRKTARGTCLPEPSCEISDIWCPIFDVWYMLYDEGNMISDMINQDQRRQHRECACQNLVIGVSCYVCYDIKIDNFEARKARGDLSLRRKWKSCHRCRGRWGTKCHQA